MFNSARLERILSGQGKRNKQPIDQQRQTAFVSVNDWIASFYICRARPILVRCSVCWFEYPLTTRNDVAYFLARKIECPHCDLVLEKGDYWPYSLPLKEAEKQFRKE